jgi:hypothetical protein
MVQLGSDLLREASRNSPITQNRWLCVNSASKHSTATTSNCSFCDLDDLDKATRSRSSPFSNRQAIRRANISVDAQPLRTQPSLHNAGTWQAQACRLRAALVILRAKRSRVAGTNRTRHQNESRIKFRPSHSRVMGKLRDVVGRVAKTRSRLRTTHDQLRVLARLKNKKMNGGHGAHAPSPTPHLDRYEPSNLNETFSLAR